MLKRVGITSIQEKLYEALIDEPSADLARLAERSGIDPEKAEHELANLAEIGLLSLTPGDTNQYAVAPPEPAIHALIHKEEEQLQHLRTHSSELAQRLRAARQRSDVSSMLEIIVGIHAIAARWDHAQRVATECVRVIDRPPYQLGPRQNFTEKEVLAGGTAYKTLYDAEILEYPSHMERARECVSWGEEARVLADIPIKMGIVDHSLILLVLLEERPDQEAAAIAVHPSILFDSLMELFDLWWRRATRLVPEKHGNAEEDENAALITLLAAGLKDEAIALDLGVSVRTVRRKIKTLCDDLGVRTRFQAGLALKEQGHL